MPIFTRGSSLTMGSVWCFMGFTDLIGLVLDQIQDRLENTIMGAIDTGCQMLPEPQLTEQNVAQVKVIAHRGDRTLPGIAENTFAAFDRALASGAWGIEFDIRWTRDLVPVVHHDQDLSRVFGVQKLISDLTWAQLAEQAPQLPLFSEMVEKYGGKVHFMIELKEQHPTRHAYQADHLNETLSQLSAGRDYHFISFEPDLFSNMKVFESELFFPIVRWEPFTLSRLALTKGFGGIMGYHALMPGSIIRRHQQAGQKCATGFIDSIALAKREIAREIPWLFSNRACEIQNFLNSVKGSLGSGNLSHAQSRNL